MRDPRRVAEVLQRVQARVGVRLLEEAPRQVLGEARPGGRRPRARRVPEGRGRGRARVPAEARDHPLGDGAGPLPRADRGAPSRPRRVGSHDLQVVRPGIRPDDQHGAQAEGGLQEAQARRAEKDHRARPQAVPRRVREAPGGRARGLLGDGHRRGVQARRRLPSDHPAPPLALPAGPAARIQDLRRDQGRPGARRGRAGRRGSREEGLRDGPDRQRARVLRRGQG